MRRSVIDQTKQRHQPGPSATALGQALITTAAGSAVQALPEPFQTVGSLVDAPVDFSALSSEYIGILYEGLLDFELKQAAADDPVVFLNHGHAHTSIG